MAEDNLTDWSASKYLILNSDAFKLMADAPDPEGYLNPASPYEAALTLYPQDNSGRPQARISVKEEVGQNPSATLSVGNRLLNYERRFENVSSKRGGPTTTDTVSGSLGPVGAFYSETGQPGNQDFEQTSYGGRVNVGPVQLYGQRNQSSQVVDPRHARFFQNPRFGQQTNTFGARGSLPFLGPGTLSGDISRQLRTNMGPQQIGQESRPMAQAPNVTGYQLGLEGPVGPGRFGLQGTLRHVRDVGMEPSLQGSYTIQDPLGLGGEFRATGSYVNPLDPNRESEARFRAAYGLRF